MLEEIRIKFDLQLFAEPEKVEDDNPAEQETGDDDEELDLSGLYEEDSEEKEEETETEESEAKEGEVEEEEQTKEQAEEKTEEQEEQEPKQKVFTQEEVNQIVGNARIKGRELEGYVKELEQLTGLDMKGVIDHVRKSQVQKKADELNLSEEEAQEMVDKDRELAQLKEEMEQFRAKQEEYNYNQEKGKFISDPLVKKYESEIDAFARDEYGSVKIPFEHAMKYVLGEKLSNGEIKDTIKTGTQNQTLANIKKNQKAAPETGGASGASDTGGLSKDEKALAKAMGIDPKDWRKYKEQKK